MRTFVTGGDGFVGTWLQEHLGAQGDEIVAPFIEITDGPAIRAAVLDAAPEAIYHLAAIANVGESWDAPERTFAVNATGTLHLIEAARALPVPPKVLLVCSSEVYGSVTPSELPLTEESPLRPMSPYAASKVAAEFLGLQAFLAHGLPVVRVRAFNHIGPRQAPSFVVSSLARQVVQASLGGSAAIKVGNLSPQRDFTDVRDVVRAYRLLIERGTPGEVYNVCSGREVRIEDVARSLISISGRDLALEVDPERVRAVETPVLRGDPTRIQRATGWTPVIPLEQTLSDVIDYWRSELTRSR